MAKLIGNKPNQVPTNGDLGKLAFQEPEAVNITGGTIDGATIGGSSAAAVTGTTVTATGLMTAQDGLVVDNDGATVATFDRATSDGTIAEFQKDGSAVGSIASRAGVVSTIILNPASGNGAGLSGGTKCVVPADEAGIIDNDVSLGISTHRFKDLYLSGGIYLGGTGAANYLDDYEEGQFDCPNPTGQSGGTINILSSVNRLSYIKIGNQVTVRGYLQVYSVTGTLSGGFVYFTGGLPFTCANLTESAQATEGSCSVVASGFANWAPVALAVQAGGTDFYIYNSTHQGNWMDATANGTGIRFCFSYQAA
jgi:hypothetical protein